MPFDWDEWGLRSLLGIEPYEVLQVLDAKRRLPVPGTDHLTGLRVLTIWGRTLAGRALIVGVYHISGFTWKIISAREMSAGELAEFAQWEGRDG